MCGFFMHLNEEKYEEKKHTPKLHWVVFQCAIFFFTFTFKCFDENLSHLSFDGDFRSILNLCTLCYRALYRRLLCKTSDAFESSKNKTTTKNCETKRNTIKWTKNTLFYYISVLLNFYSRVLCSKNLFYFPFCFGCIFPVLFDLCSLLLFFSIGLLCSTTSSRI